jgi:hypothetical protein
MRAFERKLGLTPSRAAAAAVLRRVSGAKTFAMSVLQR